MIPALTALAVGAPQPRLFRPFYARTLAPQSDRCGMNGSSRRKRTPTTPEDFLRLARADQKRARRAR